MNACSCTHAHVLTLAFLQGKEVSTKSMLPHLDAYMLIAYAHANIPSCLHAHKILACIHLDSYNILVCLHAYHMLVCKYGILRRRDGGTVVIVTTVSHTELAQILSAPVAVGRSNIIIM